MATTFAIVTQARNPMQRIAANGHVCDTGREPKTIREARQ